MELGMGLNFLLLLAMVATNIISLYHLSSTRHPSPSLPPLPPQSDVPTHLLRQLSTIRATISHLNHLRHPSPLSPSPSSPPPDLLLFSRLAPIASACSDHPDLLHRYMNYTPFTPCPANDISEHLILRGCHPLPRRRCFSPSPTSFSHILNKDDADLLRLTTARSALDLTLPQLIAISKAANAAPIRLGLDIGGGAGTLAAAMKNLINATLLTTTLDLGQPNSVAAARRGLVPLQAPLQQRFPVPDGAMDLVRAGHAVNRWIPAAALEFLLFDVDRVLRGGGLLWVDHFFCRAGDLVGVYAPMISRLGYRRIKWAVGNKTDAGGIKFGEVYLTALLQKPVAAAAAAAVKPVAAAAV